ncbi:hypothetical protein [Agromyces sp. LHK192]|uniref:hypothetical protein n=1 Tax=Agromyces sp. LHK192 TaxID=2498704 RepID=UPI000FD8CDE8|nr:hypothetical protein [Agromyces sp. LHK192]
MPATHLRNPRLRVAAAVLIGGVVATALSGCFFNPMEQVKQGVEKGIEEATGGDVSLGGEMPEGFPAEIPIVEGSITFSSGTGGEQGWVVGIDPTSADPLPEAAAALEAAGFAKDAAFDGVDLGAQIYSNGTLLVLLSGDGDALVYTVTPAPAP